MFRFLALVLAGPIWTGQATASEDFFETKVRPIFQEHCSACHGLHSPKEGGLEITSREHLLKGGSRGAGLVAGDPDASLLIRAVRRLDELKMPPDAPLSAAQLRILEDWVRRGAPWAASMPIAMARTDQSFWSFQPLKRIPPSTARNRAWPVNSIDDYVLARLEREGLAPADRADKETLIRRATLDLTGLPPTVGEIDAFLRDPSPDAFAKVIDRLLASVAYGEHWGRHWLDLVRYAESNGLELDSPKPNAFRYRDYVIDAFNADVPYDQFLREHFVGDQIDPPRWREDGSMSWSPVATGWFWFQEITQTSTDFPAALAEEMENQIDVLSRSMLGLTLACARCHDHKFDPLSQEDYYSIAGVIRSCSNIQRCIDSPSKRRQIVEISSTISEHERSIDRLRATAETSQRRRMMRRAEVERVKAYLLAAREVISKDAPQSDLEPIARRHNIPTGQLARWVTLITQAEKEPIDPVLVPWRLLSKCSDDVFDYRRRALRANLLPASRLRSEAKRHGTTLALFEGNDLEGWSEEGLAFQSRPQTELPFDAVGHEGRGVASSHHHVTARRGRLLSPPIKIDQPRMQLLFRVAGGDQPLKTCVNVLGHSPAIVNEIQYSATGANTNTFRDVVMGLTPALLGREVRIEIVDDAEGEHGYIMADDFCLLRGVEFEADGDDISEPLHAAPSILNLLSRDRQTQSADQLAAAHQEALGRVFTTWERRIDAFLQGGKGQSLPEFFEALRGSLPDPSDDELLSWMFRQEAPLTTESWEQALEPADQAELERLRRAKQSLERDMPTAAFAITCVDRNPADAPLQERGNAHRLGRPVPRGYISLLRGTRPPVTQGSGRRALADWIASKDNPLTARVMVNRLWMHHFGRGIVATPDDFGRRGERPSHPELLDDLALRFIESGWSIKRMHRLLMLSNTYQQSTRATPEARRRDPENRLFGRASHRRLTAESLRDSTLAVSGLLDRQLFGPSQPDPDDQPKSEKGGEAAESSPKTPNAFDAQEIAPYRRSIYLTVRRAAPSVFLATFDFPSPASCVGQRDVSLGPAQSLALLNGALVKSASRNWARELAQGEAGDEANVDLMYRKALGRWPTPSERDIAMRHIDSVRSRGSDSLSANERSIAAFESVAHVLFNLPEFSLIR